MDEHLAKELLQIVHSVQIYSPSSLSFAGRVSPIPKADPVSKPRTLLIQHLGRLLYLHCYSRRFKGSISDSVTTTPTEEQEFVQNLSEANTSREYLNRGWRVLRQLPTGHYVAEKNGQTRVLFAGEFVSHSDLRGPIKDGTSISIYCPRESRTMHQGFYYIFGEAIGDQQDDTRLLRFYWNTRAEGALKLVRLLTERFNYLQLPFRLKLVNNSTGYDRTDAAVLYLNERYYRIAAEVLTWVCDQVAEFLNLDTPLFSKRLRSGLGLAEDPTTGESFGQQRCRILAEAIWDINEQGLDRSEQRIEQIKNRFALNGLSLDFPYRNPGSNRPYDFPSETS